MKYQRCPTCSRRVRFIARYPRYLCRICAERTYAADGREVGFANQSIEGGIFGYYLDNREPYDTTDCFVRGVRCIADEARFGGIVVQAVESAGDRIMQTRRQKSLDHLISPWMDEHSEFLWNNWRWGGIEDEPDLAKRFSLEFAPEPYLVFADPDSPLRKPLFILLTNPGSGRREQSRKVILGEKISTKSQPVTGKMFYSEAAVEFGRHYLRALKDRPAGRRNKAMRALQDKLDCDCIVQFETIPFHSRSLPGKRRLVDQVRKLPALRDYYAALQNALSKVSVICLSAVGTSRSISKSVVADSTWLKFQAELMGIDVSKLKTEPLVRKGRKVSSAFLYQQLCKDTRGFVLTMGSNSFPAEDGLVRICEVLRKIDGPR